MTKNGQGDKESTTAEWEMIDVDANPSDYTRSKASGSKSSKPDSDG
jgi:hypothetical protein